MAENKMGPSDFKAEVERLRAAGKPPSLDEVLAVVAETREKYAAKIVEVRQRGSEFE